MDQNTSHHEKLLTIVIPTRNRANQVVDTIEHFVRIIEASAHNKDVELICVDNFSSDQTWAILNSAKDSHGSNLDIYQQKSECMTAESSAISAAGFASGKYVWLFGDDDIPHSGAIDSICRVLLKEGPALLLLNIYRLINGRACDYICSHDPIIRFERGIDLFRSFGLISATTTISSLIYNREELDVELFWKLNKLSEFYSHSCTLLGSFFDKACIFYATPLLTYRQNTLEEEASRIGRFSTEGNTTEFYPYTAGIAKLLTKVSMLKGIRLNEILAFEEIEISKSTWKVKHSLLWCFIARMAVESTVKHSVSKGVSTISLESEIGTVATLLPEIGPEGAYIADKVLYLQELSALEVLRLSKSLHKFLDAVENSHFISKLPAQSVGSLYFQPGVAPKVIARTSPNPKEGNKILLSILIPTYSRPRALARLISKMAEIGLLDISDVEVVIAVNYDSNSLSGYKAVEKEWKDKYIRIIFAYHTSFEDTAEGNINRSISLCHGDYVQILGDDDQIVPCTFAFMLSILRNPERDLKGEVLIFNSNQEVSSAKQALDIGSFSGLHDFPFISNSLSFESMVMSFGLTTAMAFISRYVFKASLFMNYDDFLAISPVYSHVFGLLRSFKTERCIIFDFPIVIRGDSDVDSRFSTMADSNNIEKLFYWTDGLLLLAEYGVKTHAVSEDFLFRISENPEHNRYFDLWKEILLQYSRQLVTLSETSPSVERSSTWDICLQKFLAKLTQLPELQGRQSRIHITQITLEIMSLYKQLNAYTNSSLDIKNRSAVIIERILELDRGDGLEINNWYFYSGRWESTLNILPASARRLYKKYFRSHSKRLYQKIKYFLKESFS